MISAFIFALFATLGFCIIFHVPPKRIPIAALIGSFGWVSYQAFLLLSGSGVVSCFIASCVVGLLSDIASRVFKDAATIFIVPGILCLVPGSGMYNTMFALVAGELNDAAAVGSRTLMMAGSIALGLLVVGALIRICVSIFRRARCIAGKL